VDADTAKDWCKELLRRLDSAFRWAIGFTAAFFLIAVDTQAPVKLLDVQVQRGTAGVVLFILLIGSFVEIGRGLTTLLHITQADDAAAATVKVYVRLDFGIGNSFAESWPKSNILVDSIGVLLDILVWCLGAVAGRALLLRSNVPDATGMALFILYAIVGLWIAGLGARLIHVVSSTHSLRIARYTAAIIARVAGATLGYVRLGL